MNPQNKLLCCSCMNARKSGARVLGCRTIGNPELVWRYNNKCRRYKPKRPTATDLCPGCIYFATSEDWDMCLAEPSESDTTTDKNQVIKTCKLYRAK